MISDLIGLTIRAIEKTRDRLVFHTTDGRKFVMAHDQDCCESVSIEDIVGNLDDLIGAPILMAETATSDKNPEDTHKEGQDSFTWTFYEFATVKGYVTVRWYGESNGYYSESVNFTEVGKCSA